MKRIGSNEIKAAAQDIDVCAGSDEAFDASERVISRGPLSMRRSHKPQRETEKTSASFYLKLCLEKIDSLASIIY